MKLYPIRIYTLYSAVRVNPTHSILVTFSCEVNAVTISPVVGYCSYQHLSPPPPPLTGTAAVSILPLLLVRMSLHVDLVVFRGRFLLRKGAVDILRFHEEYYQKHGVACDGGKVEFFHLGNKISVTKNGYLRLYLCVNVPSAVEQIEETLHRVGETFLPFTSGFSEIKYSAASVHLSGKFAFKGSILFNRLKPMLQTLFPIIDIIASASGERSTTSVDPSKLAVEGCTFTSLKVKVPEGKLCVVHSGSFTIITTKFKFI